MYPSYKTKQVHDPHSSVTTLWHVSASDETTPLKCQNIHNNKGYWKTNYNCNCNLQNMLLRITKIIRDYTEGALTLLNDYNFNYNFGYLQPL